MLTHQIELPAGTLFSPQECIWFLNRDYDDCSYRVYPGKIRRAFRHQSELMLVDIYPKKEKIELRWLTDNASVANVSFVKGFVKAWFSMERDLREFYQLLSRRTELAYMPRQYEGLRFIGMPDLFEALAWCIIGQQINLTFAYKIKRRLTEHYGSFIDYQDERYFIFPTPESLAEADLNELRNMQFSSRKAEYIVTIAQAFKAGLLHKQLLQELPDYDSRLKKLLAIRGVGQWTANYVLMKSLGEPGCIPHGDAGLLNALMNHQLIKAKDDMEAIAKVFGDFKGWESYLVFYLWRSLAPTPEERS